jgi:hypothetical protein
MRLLHIAPVVSSPNQERCFSNNRQMSSDDVTRDRKLGNINRNDCEATSVEIANVELKKLVKEI